MPPTFMPFGRRSSSARYSPYVFHRHDIPSRMLAAGMSSTDSMSSARYSRSSGLHGANVTPQLPSTTDVTPCQHDDHGAVADHEVVCHSLPPRAVHRSLCPGRKRPLALEGSRGKTYTLI